MQGQDSYSRRDALRLARAICFPDVTTGTRVLLTQCGEELPYIRQENGEWFLFSKVTAKRYVIPLVYGSACQENVDAQSANDCHKCHDVSGNLKRK